MSDDLLEDYPASRANEVSAEQVDADIDDLQTSLGDLAALVTGARALPDLLAQVATYAAHALTARTTGWRRWRPATPSSRRSMRSST